jgi:hypothetical protein
MGPFQRVIAAFMRCGDTVQSEIGTTVPYGAGLSLGDLSLVVGPIRDAYTLHLLLMRARRCTQSKLENRR